MIRKTKDPAQTDKLSRPAPANEGGLRQELALV